MRITKYPNLGWFAESFIELGNKAIQITTCKRSNGCISTTAKGVRRDGNFISHTLFIDFNKTYASEKKNATEKAVRTQHEQVLTLKDQILDDYKVHYCKDVD